MRPLETALVELFQHLGIGQAHFAAGQLVPTDWIGLAARYPECIASLTLVSPRVRRPELESLGPRLMVLAGDTGPSGQGSAKLLAELTQAQSLVLRDYEYVPWSDLVADRRTEIAAGWLRFLDGLPLPAPALSDGEGEVAGITYRIRGTGPPLVLMPLDLAPAQWEPLIAELVPRYSTITLGGPLVGVIALLESRGRSNYLAVIRALLDLVAIEPGETVLEVGGGSGVVLREIARRTAGANAILDIDINPYLLREAAALAAREGLAERIEFREGSAEALPLADASIDVALALTVMEEGDADRMMAELMRVNPPRRSDWCDRAIAGYVVVVESTTQPRFTRQGGPPGGSRQRRIANRLSRCQPLQPLLRRRACRSALLSPACLCHAPNRADAR